MIDATNPSKPQFTAARDWLDASLSGHPQSEGLAWLSLFSFLRLVTNPRVFAVPAAPADAWARIEDWLSRIAAWIPQPTPRHQHYLAALVRGGHVAGDLVPDADLAALAAEHGLTVAAADADFARFPGIARFNPVSS